MMDDKFFIEKVRELFDLDQKIELAKKILYEKFGVYAHDVGVEEDYKGCKRVYARCVHSFFSFDYEEWIFIGETEDGKYYANFIEYEVREIDKQIYEDWDGSEVVNKLYPHMLCYELRKDIEKYGLFWRLFVRVGVFKKEDNDAE